MNLFDTSPSTSPLENVNALDVIQLARKSWPIFLGGSRRMHELAGDVEYIEVFGVEADSDTLTIPITDQTDHDFYATYSSELTTFLLDRGFDTTTFVDGLDEGGYSLDSEAVTILERDNVQIVLRTDAVFYQTVFDNIDPWFYREYLWKSSGEPTVIRENIQLIFNMLFKIADPGRNRPS